MGSNRPSCVLISAWLCLLLATQAKAGSAVAAINPSSTILTATNRNRRRPHRWLQPKRAANAESVNKLVDHNHDLLLGLRGGWIGIATDASMDLPVLTLTPGSITAFGGAALVAAFTVGLVKKLPRSGGHAPAPIAGFLGKLSGINETGSTGLFHLAYFLHCFVVLAIMPQGIKEAVFSPAGVLLLGAVFPLIESINAAASSDDNSAAVSRTWLMYWIMHGLFSFAANDMSKMIERFGAQFAKHWYEFQFYMVLWLILPFTDGAAIIYEMVTKPYVVPIIAPITKAAEGWLTTVALTLINASHLWFVAFFFMALPSVLKRFAVLAIGTYYPVASSIVAVATKDDDSTAIDKWLTYWSCFSLLYLAMLCAERLVGKVPGLYTLCLAVTLYLMLPIFDGSSAVFREILVPLFRQREALLVKDARKLAKNMIRQLPVSRHSAASQAASKAFLEEANKLLSRE